MIDLPVQVRFGRGEAGNDLLLNGFDEPEDGFVWTVGKQSRLLIPRVPADGAVFIELTLAPFVHPGALASQRVEILVNGVVLAARFLACETTLRLAVPQFVRRGALMTIMLRHPDAVSPQDLGAGEDGRALGMRLTALTLLHMAARNALPPASGQSRLTDLRFGLNEDTANLLGEGWGAPERDYVWSVGRHSVLRLPVAQEDGRIILHLNPYLAPAGMAAQRVAIGVDGQLLGFVSLNKRCSLAFVLPVRPPRARQITMSFDNLDAAAPRAEGLYQDGRPFAFMLCGIRLVQGRPPPPCPGELPAPFAGSLDDGTLQDAVLRATGLAAADLAAGFESLGFACELGLLQRRLGSEPSGLLRFSGISTPCLVDGILNGFWGLGRPDTMVLHRREDDGCGYWVEEAAYELGFQTPVSSLSVTEPQIRRSLARALPFLVRKFFEDVAAAEKIFVFQRRGPATREEADAVLAALSVWGDVHVLWVVQDNARPGRAQRLTERLLVGFVDTFGEFGSGSHDSWVGMLGNIRLLVPGGDRS